MYSRESAPSAKRRPDVGPVPAHKLEIPRGRHDPFIVVASLGDDAQGDLVCRLGSSVT